MSNHDHRVRVEDALNSRLCKTEILNNYRDGYIVEVYALNIRGEDRTIYKVFTNQGTFLLKTTTYFTSNIAVKDKIDQELKITDQYKIDQNGEILSNFLKLKDRKEYTDKLTHKTTIEVLYEFGEQTLQSKLEEMSTTERIEAMKKLLIPMEVLEQNGVIHGALRPENVIIEHEKCLIADFGVKFDSFNEERMNSVMDSVICKMLDEMDIYAPPELFQGDRNYPTKIDIYVWGMCLYQLITDMTNDVMKQKISLRKNERTYGEFLSEIKNLKLTDKGVDVKLQKWVKSVLLRVLSYHPEKRPNFRTIKNEANMDTLIYKAENKQHRRVVKYKGNVLG